MEIGERRLRVGEAVVPQDALGGALRGPAGRGQQRWG
jgi:hypothetical protein